MAAYGKIIPRTIIDLPKHGTLNVHPSLLPNLRGASPIQSGILDDVAPGTQHETGVTIMQIDEQVDHGPIVAQEKITVPNWPPKGKELEETLGKLGGELLVKTIAPWVSGSITPTEQDHDHATYTKKMTSGSGQIYLDDDPVRMYRKIRAFDSWPARISPLLAMTRHTRRGYRSPPAADKLVLDRVIPEGKRNVHEDFTGAE